MTTPIAAAPAAPAAAPATTPTAPVKNGAPEGAPQQSSDPKPASAKNAEPGAKPGETAAETRQRMKVKLRKLDGPGEEELELDDNEIGRYVQKARVADRNRAADEKAKAEWMAERDAAVKDPLAFFRERGADLVELGKQEAARLDELAKLDPVQRQLAEANAKLAKYETDTKAAAEQAALAAEQAEARELVVGEQRLYKQAMAASGRNAKTPAEAGYLMRLYADVREMAEYAEIPLTAEQLAAAGDKLEMRRFTDNTKRIASDPAWRAKNMGPLKELATAMLGNMTPAEIVSFLGTKNVDLVTRQSLEALRKSPIPIVGEVPAPAPAVTSATRQPSQGEESLMGMMDRIANR